MNDYFIRVLAADYPTLIALGKLLGVIEEGTSTGITATQGGCWDYIGAIYAPTGTSQIIDGMTVPDLASLKDAQGAEYIHINLRTSVNLAEKAAEMAVESPEIEAGMDNLSKYFLLDAKGNARSPTQPKRVFA